MHIVIHFYKKKLKYTPDDDTDVDDTKVDINQSQTITLVIKLMD